MADNYTTQADPSATQTFASFGVTSFTAQYWDGSAWQTVSGGSVTGNNLVWKKLTFTAVTTNKIRVVANAAVDSVARIVEVEAWGTAAVAPVNVASTTNGATATAQNYTADSTYPGSHFQPPYATDGVRYSTTIGDHYWRDEHGLSSWLQIDFSGSKTINEIDVYTMADNYATQADPSSTLTFANYGVTSFTAQYWDGSAWQTVPGGNVTSNNLVWKKLTFSNITTTKIRVVANAAVDSVARIVEVEAWTPAASAQTANLNWLVTDQLGTPRMVFDQSGALATVKRHDYAPFGEELFAGTGGRTTGVGYSVADGVRQKFTQKERDIETGLDYFLARYYSSIGGRFISADPLLSSGRPVQPQSWNRYTYVINRPLSLVDPNGLDWGISNWDKNGHRNYRWFNGKKMGKGYSAVDFGKDGSLDINSNGTLVRIKNTGIVREVLGGPPSGGGTRGGMDGLNFAAGHLHGVASALTGGSPVGQAIVNLAFSQIGGVSKDSDLYKKGDMIGGLVTAGITAFIIPSKPDAEYVNLTKQLASEAGVAEVLAGEGKAIMGAGTNRVLMDAPRLAAEYGGESADWAKVSSSAFKTADKLTIETHAYQNIPSGKVVELKSVSSGFPGRQ